MNLDLRRSIVNFVAFQAGWFASVMFAANGTPLYGLLVATAVVLLHLKLTADLGSEIKLIVAAVVMGVLFDALIVSSGWVEYAGGKLLPGFGPYWILGIWAIFATTLNTSMKWLKGRFLLAGLMGAIFGPLSYLAGARLGGIQFINFESALVLLALSWALALPLLMFLATQLDSKHTGLAQYQVVLSGGRN